jgi:hypothetical protein
VKTKRIDEILKSAFGEMNRGIGPLSEEERVEFEKARAIREGLVALKDVPEHQLSNERLRDAVLAQMTNAQRNEFRLSNTIHAGLDSLKDVPEHQLSNERLRTAILATAVQPRRFSGWSLATAGVACLAVGLVALRAMSPTPSEGPVATNEPTVAPFATGPDNASALDNGQTQIEAPREDRRNNSPTLVAKSVERETAPMDPEYRLNESALASIVKSMDFSVGEEPEAATSMKVDGAGKDSIVVVDPNSRTRNGAAKATEMASYGDVVFGG